MTDDRRNRPDDDDFSEYGSLFGDDTSEDAFPPLPASVQQPGPGKLSFGDSDETGPLPHWSEPATGELPSFASRESRGGTPQNDQDDELDVWSSFSSDAPIWQDDQASDDEAAAISAQVDGVTTGTLSAVSGQVQRVSDEAAVAPREPSRITIGTDPSGITRPDPDDFAPSRGKKRRSSPSGPTPSTPSHAPTGIARRDMPTAIAVGLALAAAFLASLMFDTRIAIALIAIVLGLGAAEFYARVSERRYRPATVPGIVTCVFAPLACYWLGVGTLPLVLAFGFIVVSASFLGARSIESGPMPNISMTMLGICWVGLLGSFAALILRLSTQPVSTIPDIQALVEHRGTDTIVLLAVGVVVNDIGALLIGSVFGRTSLRAWVSPNKTVEGLIGGAALTLVAMMVVGLFNLSDTWSSMWHLLLLGLVIAVFAPLGDLVESMFKRNLDVKDFGTLVRGHGGVLDRFDGFLFSLPAVYYLTLVLEPWTKYVAS